VARIIPAFADERTPPGEVDVFNLLAAGPDDWTAIHSLDLAPWHRGLRTEIDFLIIDPATGILCVEVKSQERISFDGIRWQPGTLTRSPFKQAADARHTLYRRLSSLLPWLRGVPVVHCCIFPRASFDISPNLSVQPWELIDGRQFRQYSSGNEFCADIREKIQHSVSADANLTSLERRMSAAEIEELVNHCVPVQRNRPDQREEIAHRATEMERFLRQQQKPLIQLTALNRRMIVSGGAGTGKTLIAMETARRAAEAGRRVALLCFNQLVGDAVKRRMAALRPALPNLVVGRAIRVIADMADVAIPADASVQYWDVELPSLLEERLTDPDFKSAASIDYLVLDEAQDVLARPWLWGCLAQLLVGGIKRGAFALFGDFDNQVLREREKMTSTLHAVAETSHPTKFRLSENCRNYRIVGDTAVNLAGLELPVYEGYMRMGGALNNYDVFFYEDDAAQLAKVAELLRYFKALGYRPSEMVLLSPRADEDSAATKLKRSGWRLRAAWQDGDQTAYASIQAYKGMESKVVILTDLYLQDKQFHRDLFYTGMTRATESVRVLCDVRSREALRVWLTRKN
jgi:Nuclease-related domain/UvrD-like helicase C-terminal domain/AAA domain